jgi:hypothetical protein
MRLAHPVVLAAVLCTGLASAQATHKDTRLGFSFKPPKDYQAIAIAPGDTITAAKYQDPTPDAGSDEMDQPLSRSFQVDFFPIAEVRQDKGGENATGAESKAREIGTRSVDEWWEDTLDHYFGGPEVEKDKPLSLAGATGHELCLVPKQEPVKLYVAMVPQEDGVFVMTGISLATRYDKAAQDFSKAAKSFKRIGKEDDAQHQADLSRMDEQERFLQQQIDKLPPGWSHLRTNRYLFLYDADKDFVELLSKQIEGLRAEYERLYPPDPARPITAVSIVRVCASFDEFQGYSGAGPGVGGFWNSEARELVIYDKAPRSETLCVLNHEAFHQYIFYFYGELSPHSWYNEGTGDYFAGAKLTKTFRITGYGNLPGGFARQDFVKEMALATRQGKTVAQGALAPLKALLDYTHAQYYDDGGGIRPVAFYPEGWAFVYMLRECKNLPPEWQRILPDYLVSLVAARQEAAEALMKKNIAAAEKTEPGSGKKLPQTPEAYYKSVDVEEVQHAAYLKTFKAWTDEDWKKLDAFFLEYVEKL